MKIFVAGATGVIGQRAVPRMIARGHQVTAAGRSPSRLARLSRAGAATLVIDLFDQAAVTKAVAGHDAVVNVATHVPVGTRAFLPWAWRETSRLRKTGSAILATAAIAAGAERFVQESFALTYPDSGDRWIDETMPIRPARYNRSTADAEASAARVTGAGGAGVALRFALLYGANDPFTRDLFSYVKRGILPMFGRADGYLSMVTQDDAAAAVVAALEVPAGIYNVVEDEPLTRRELGATLADIVGAKPPKIPPAWLAPLAGAIGTTIARSLRLSNRKLKSASAWSPRYASTRESWRAAYASDANRESAAG